MKILHQIIILTSLLFLLNCEKKKTDSIEEIFPLNQIAEDGEYDSLYASASNGNCEAFLELYIDMMEYQDKSSILTLSKNTFHKNNNCEPAINAYFNALCRKYEIGDHYEIAGRDLSVMNHADYLEAIKCLQLMLKNGSIKQADYDHVIKKGD